MELEGPLGALADPVLRGKVNKALYVLDRTFALYAKGSVALSFNGGKDSTVLLHLVRLTVSRQSENVEGMGGVHSFFFQRDAEFPEVISFVQHMDQVYGLQTDFIQESCFKSGLSHYLERTGCTAILLGTRRGDPNAGEQELFCPSSAGWPPFMRVNPILDWTYHDVWNFLRTCQVPYCSLYDQGYTSLGERHSTRPNNALKKDDGTHLPAYLLTDGRLERAGRSFTLSNSEGSGTFDAPSALTWNVGLLVVGDEILAGKVEDVNTSFLCRELRSIGWSVRKVVMVQDDVSVISRELKALSTEMEVVITSGGLGPTLDDVTMQGIALAVEKPLVRHPELADRILQYFQGSASEAHFKMAEAPDEETEIINYCLDTGEQSTFPLVKVRNIYVLPGVPHLLRQKWRVIREELQKAVHLNPFRNIVVRLSISDETMIAGLLQQLVEDCGVSAAIGSYPVTKQSDGAGIIVTFEGKLVDELEMAFQVFQSRANPSWILSVHRDLATLSTKRNSFTGIRE